MTPLATDAHSRGGEYLAVHFTSCRSFPSCSRFHVSRPIYYVLSILQVYLLFLSFGLWASTMVIIFFASLLATVISAIAASRSTCFDAISNLASLISASGFFISFW